MGRKNLWLSSPDQDAVHDLRVAICGCCKFCQLLVTAYRRSLLIEVDTKATQTSQGRRDVGCPICELRPAILKERPRWRRRKTSKRTDV